MWGESNKFLDAFFAVKSATSAEEAFEKASQYFNHLGFEHVCLNGARVISDPKCANGIDILAIETLFETSSTRATAYYEEYSYNKDWIQDMSVRPFHIGNTGSFFYGDRFTRILLDKFTVPGVIDPNQSMTVSNDLHDSLNSGFSCVLPIMSPMSDDVPTASINIFGRPYEGPIQTELIANFQHAGDAPMILAYSLAEALRGYVLRVLDHSKALSPREKECLQFVAAGVRPQRIANRLGLSLHTVYFHLNSAKTKLSATTMPHAVARAIMYNEIQV